MKTSFCHTLDEGIHVICDRYVLSNYAYQSVRAPLNWVMSLNSVANDTVKPDCHIFIDVTPEVSLERMANAVCFIKKMIQTI